MPNPVYAAESRDLPMNQQASADYQFDRPIIIVAAPRSGSTLLFETMSKAQALWTIGDESHLVFETVRKLNPAFGNCQSNRLLASDADSDIVQHIRGVFFAKLHDAAGNPYRGGDKPRFLEKTPKNSLRIPFLNELFPDALYIYLYRDPRENISSIMGGWRSSGFVTYARLPEWPERWSFLLPPNYQDMRGKPLEEIAAFQWQAANQYILDDLAKMPSERWTAASYQELVMDAAATIGRLCDFAAIPFDAGLKQLCATTLPLSRYTRTTPQAGKWRSNAAEIERVLPGVQPLIERMSAAVRPYTTAPVLTTAAEEARDAVAESAKPRENDRPGTPLGRNERCFCGSGLRYKHCHGKR